MSLSLCVVKVVNIHKRHGTVVYIVISYVDNLIDVVISMNMALTFSSCTLNDSHVTRLLRDG